MTKRLSPHHLPLVLAALERARTLIKAGWVQGHYVTNSADQGVGVASTTAAKFCAQGAVLWTYHEMGPALQYDLTVTLECLYRLNAAANCPNIGHWNDVPSRTHQEVLEVFDRAIRDLPGAAP